LRLRRPFLMAPVARCGLVPADNRAMTPTSAPANTHPYESLTPDVVLDALATLDLHGDGRLTALNSYENRVYQVFLDQPAAHASVVVKFYRPGRWTSAEILEEHAFSLELAAADVPAVAPIEVHGATLHHHDGFAFSVSPYRGGRSPELDDFEVLEWVGRFLARIHTIGAARPFAARPALDLQSFGIASRDWLLGNEKIPLDVQREWEKACNEALDRIAATALSPTSTDATLRKLRLHGDVHPGNILWTPTDRPDGGPHFVDLDDARTGFAVQDLWMLLSGDRAQRTGQLSGLLDGYEQFRSFDRRELALIEPLRTLRLIHYSAWLARRWEDPIFPINFPWFGTSDYWKGQIQMLQDQCESMDEEPLYA
jgi:Ser/Thr protein kinase RdoA (MazF antagonist)